MNYKQYLFNLSSGNIVPITKQIGNSYMDITTNIDALLNLTLDSTVAPRYRIFLVNADDTIQSEFPLEDVLQGGTFSENYQNGQRCSLSLTLFNQGGKYTPNINKLWIGTKMRLDAGLQQQDGGVIWCQKGIFVITSTQPSYAAENKTVAISAGDKFADLEGGVGILQDTYEIPSGSRIYGIVKELLGIQRGDGYPIDARDPYFHPSLANKVTQAKISKNAGETVGSIILELANQMSAEVFYSAEGRLCFYPLNVVSDDNDKPILFNYMTDKGELTDLNFSLDYNNIINRIILIGATVNGGVVKSVASNDDPSSPLCIQRIGARTSVVNESGIKTKIVAEENAKYQLRKQLILKSSVSLNIPYNPVFGVNNLIMITDNFFHLVKQYFLIQSISFGLDYSGRMTMSVSNLNNLPFITSYVSSIEEDEDKEIKYGDILSYPITCNITLGSATGSSSILKKGAATITIIPTAGYVLPNTISVAGARYTYNSITGVVVLDNPTQTVVISATCIIKNYEISINVVGGSYTGATTIASNGTATISVNASSNYVLPDDIEVSGAQLDSWDYSTSSGVITLSHPTQDVSVKVQCLPRYGKLVELVFDRGIFGWDNLYIYDGTLGEGNCIDVVYPTEEATSIRCYYSIASSFITIIGADTGPYVVDITDGDVSYESSGTAAGAYWIMFNVEGNGYIEIIVNTDHYGD